jgi:hypothetical protein
MGDVPSVMKQTATLDAEVVGTPRLPVVTDVAAESEWTAVLRAEAAVWLIDPPEILVNVPVTVTETVCEPVGGLNSSQA